MKFLIDNALSPLIAEGLKRVGYDAVHVREYDMQTASDSEMFAIAMTQERIIVSADTKSCRDVACYVPTESLSLYSIFNSTFSSVPLFTCKLLSSVLTVKTWGGVASGG
ncbi:MAG: DUF5615 family PIN-like protein [Cyanobacteria bacterium P01_E01_bin.42]